MKRAVALVVLACAIASSAALAGPHWTADSKGGHALSGFAPRNDHVDRGRTPSQERTGNGGQSGWRGDNNRSGDNRGDGSRTRDPEPQRHTGRDSGWNRNVSRELDGNSNGRPSGDRPAISDRGERRFARDPRPPTKWDHDQTNWNNDGHGDRQDSRERGPGRNWDRGGGDQRARDGNNWNGDRGWDQNHWRDDHGHDWHHERGWYDRYRVDHFRYYGGRYYGRTRYSYGYYYLPFAYTSRVWIAGDWLPSAYIYDGRYFIDDYWRFGLYEPPFGCGWIRVSGDALLIDLATREIVDAIYNLYW